MPGRQVIVIHGPEGTLWGDMKPGLTAIGRSGRESIACPYAFYAALIVCVWQCVLRVGNLQTLRLDTSLSAGFFIGSRFVRAVSFSEYGL